MFADCSLNIHRGEDKPFIRAFRGDTESSEVAILKIMADCIVQFTEVWRNQIKRNRTGYQEIGNPEHMDESIFDDFFRNARWNDDADTAPQVFNAFHAEALEGPLDIAHETLFEMFAVAAFESELVVMDDHATHS